MSKKTPKRGRVIYCKECGTPMTCWYSWQSEDYYQCSKCSMFLTVSYDGVEPEYDWDDTREKYSGSSSQKGEKKNIDKDKVCHRCGQTGAELYTVTIKNKKDKGFVFNKKKVYCHDCLKELL